MLTQYAGSGSAPAHAPLSADSKATDPSMRGPYASKGIRANSRWASVSRAIAADWATDIAGRPLEPAAAATASAALTLSAGRAVLWKRTGARNAASSVRRRALVSTTAAAQSAAASTATARYSPCAAAA